jgi:hypothetical protein
MTRTLIDAIVRQTVVLIAQLATSRGLRAPLAHIAERVFQELSRELERQGVTRKVSADMFGMALRTYQRRTQRVERSVTERGRSLWEAVFAHIGAGGVVNRDGIFRRFRHDDECGATARQDLTDSGLVLLGKWSQHHLSRHDRRKRSASPRTNDRAGIEALLWSIVFARDR